MFYDYECQNCNTVTEIELSPNTELPGTIICQCGFAAKRIYGGHQINMRNWQSKIHEYNSLPEHAKEMNGVIKKHI